MRGLSESRGPKTDRCPPDYAIAPAADHHLAALAVVEMSAASRFRGWHVPHYLRRAPEGAGGALTDA